MRTEKTTGKKIEKTTEKTTEKKIEKKPEKKTGKRAAKKTGIMKKAGDVAGYLILILFLLLAAALGGVRLLGYQPYCVLTGSMEPVYHVGSLIYVKDVPVSEIAVGDPITFVLDENLTVATHRVVRIDEEEERFYTKGDANEYEDASPVLFGNYIGKPMYTIPGLGYVTNFISNSPGKQLFITACIVFLILFFAPDLMRLAEKSDKKEKKKQKRQKQQKQQTQQR